MTVFWEGVIGIMACYIFIMFIGIWAGYRMKSESEIETMNAGRRFGIFVGTLTFVGTWAGGGYIVGSAEQLYSSGVLNVQAPVGYSAALLFGALFFIKPMRDGNYVTMVDLFQKRYGRRYGASLILPALLGEFFWIAAVLNSLGTALRVVLELEMWICIIVSGFFAGLYTFFGGLTSVSYTDVAQLFFIVAGLVLICPFAYYNENHIYTATRNQWLGHIEKDELPTFLEEYVLLCLGGIPWQGYFQRVFSIKTTEKAQHMSYFSFLMLLFVAVPALYVGVIALETDWTHVPGVERKIEEKEYVLILPLSLRYLTPKWVAVIGLSAISGGVMSSADSAILASSALFSRNVYKHLIRQNASDKELHIVLRTSICVVTFSASILAVYVNKVYYLSTMCSDIVYVVLFPQLLLAVYCTKYTNTYGSLSGYAFSMFFRVFAGEKNLGMPAIIKFPGYSEEKQSQHFPFRSTICLISGILIIFFSWLTKYLFVTKACLKPKYDIMKVFIELHPDYVEDEIVLPSQEEIQRTMSPERGEETPKKSSLFSKISKTSIMQKIRGKKSDLSVKSGPAEPKPQT